MTRKCSNCGAYLIEGDFTCQVCGAKQDISNFKTKKDQPPTKTEKNNLPMIAGILLIIGGIIALITWLSLTFTDPVAIEEIVMQVSGSLSVENPADFADLLYQWLVICGAAGIALSILVILGGILAIKRIYWGFTIVCSILGLFLIGPFLISSILSLIAIIMIVKAKNDFT